MCARNGYYGVLDYKTNTIPTLGASNSTPHEKAIKEIQDIIDAELHPIITWFKRKFRNIIPNSKDNRKAKENIVKEEVKPEPIKEEVKYQQPNLVL